MTIETGLSDFHKLPLAVIKVFYKKQQPNTIKYSSYQKFDNDAFIRNLRVVFSEICNENELLSFETFKNIVDHTLETHTPLKRRYERANQSSFINRKINKDIIKDFFSKCDQIHCFWPIWSHLLNKFLMKSFIFCAVLKI